MRADDVALELAAQDLRRDVLDGADLAVSRVVEERVQVGVGQLQHLQRAARNRARIGEVQIQRLDADLAMQPLEILLLAGGGEYAPAARLHEPRRGEADAG